MALTAFKRLRRAIYADGKMINIISVIVLLSIITNLNFIKKIMFHNENSLKMMKCDNFQQIWLFAYYFAIILERWFTIGITILLMMLEEKRTT